MARIMHFSKEELLSILARAHASTEFYKDMLGRLNVPPLDDDAAVVNAKQKDALWSLVRALDSLQDAATDTLTAIEACVRADV